MRWGQPWPVSFRFARTFFSRFPRRTNWQPVTPAAENRPCVGNHFVEKADRGTIRKHSSQGGAGWKHLHQTSGNLSGGGGSTYTRSRERMRSGWVCSCSSPHSWFSAWSFSSLSSFRPLNSPHHSLSQNGQ